jgi:hypothetical protein
MVGRQEEDAKGLGRGKLEEADGDFDGRLEMRLHRIASKGSEWLGTMRERMCRPFP